jgi:sugar porter (SP) family MFS transporter
MNNLLNIDKMRTGNARVDGLHGIMLRDVIPKREKFWWHYPALRTLNFLLLGAIAANVTNGYDGSMLNGLQIIPEWKAFFHKPTGVRLGLISNGTRIGQVGALLLTAPLLTKFGRRKPIILGHSIMIIGIILQTAAQNFPMFVIGRVFIGFGNMIQQAACPVLIAELAYPPQRAIITGFLNCGQSLGTIMAAWITYGTAFMVGSSWSWRLPSALQGFSSIFQLTMVLFIPESPRWLVFNDRREEAFAILTKYHAEGDSQSEFLKFEMAEIDNAIETEKANTLSSWFEWIRTPASRYRLCIIVSLGFMIQWCGNALISYYLSLVLNSVGITKPKTQLLINGGITIMGLVFAIIFSLSMERVGRRPLFLVGFAGMFFTLFIFTILTGVNQNHGFRNHAMGTVCVVLIYIFNLFYKMPAPVVDTYISEVAPYDLRAKAFVLLQATDAGSNLFNGFVNPIGLVAIKYKYYIVWCCLLVSHFLIAYFFFPETKGLSLEEVAEVFEGRNTDEKLEHIEENEKSNVDAVEIRENQ